jgi:quinol monooxygenase YgiN|tara:strand:+ start:410 stop:730 length:321 start_codon:yes stop_codon:yes gene_type:complete
MSYIVHVTAVVKGDLERIEALINDYRYNCLQNQPGMKSFFVCRSLDQPNVFLYTQVFKDADAHKVHIEGDDPKTFFAKMEAENFHFQGRWMAGQEIDSVPSGHLLN